MKHKSKCNLNSGNTIKFRGRVQQVSRSKCQNFILKTLVNELPDACPRPPLARGPSSASEERTKSRPSNAVFAAAAYDVVPDGDIQLSLNVSLPFRQALLTVDKRKRWLLPEIVADCIRDLDEERTSIIDDELRNATSRTRRQRRQHQRHVQLIYDQLGAAVRVSVHRHVMSGFGRSYDSMDRRPGVLRRAGIISAVDCTRPTSTRNASGHVARRSVAHSRRVRNSFYDRLKADRWRVRRNGDAGVAASTDLLPQVASAAGVEVQPLASRVRTNTRGLQRLRKNDRASDGKKMVSNSKVFKLATASTRQAADRAVPASVTEVRYEVFTRMPVIAHRHFNDSRHRDRFPWKYLFGHPKKSLKKVIGKRHPWTDQRLPTSAVELSQHIRMSHDEHLADADDWPHYDAPDDECDSDGSTCPPTTDNVDAPRSSRPITANLSDFISNRKPSARRRKRATLTSDDRENRTSMCGYWEALQFSDDSRKSANSDSCRRRCRKDAAVVVDASVGVAETTIGVTGSVLSVGGGVEMRDGSAVGSYTTTDLSDTLQWSSIFFTERHDFRCAVVNRSSIESLAGSLRDRYAEGRSISRRFLVDLTGCRQKTRRERYTNRRRVYLICEEMPIVEGDRLRLTSLTRQTAAISFYLRCHVIGDDVTSVGRVLRDTFDDVTVEEFGVVLGYIKDLVKNDSETLEHSVTTSVNAVPDISQIPSRSAVSLPSSSGDLVCGDETTAVTLSSLVECGICCRTCDMETRRLSLSECRHWFCEDCWQRHLATAILQNKPGELQCPGHECSSAVDSVTLASLLPLSLVDRYMAYTETSSVRWRHYSNLRQQRVTASDHVTIGQLHQVDVNDGGIKLSGGHSTNKNERRQRLIRARNFATKVAFVRVKRCPHCHVPIDKYLGCDHMTCSRCNYEFCWLCGRRWSAPCACPRGVIAEPQMMAFVPLNTEILLNLRDTVSNRSVDAKWQNMTSCENAELNVRLGRINEFQRRIDSGSPDWLRTAGSEWISCVEFKMLQDNDGDVNHQSGEKASNIVNKACTFYFDAKFAIGLEYKLRKTEWNCSRIDAQRHNQLRVLKISVDKVEKLLFRPHPQIDNSRLMVNLVDTLETGVQYLTMLKKRFISTCY